MGSESVHAQAQDAHIMQHSTQSRTRVLACYADTTADLSACCEPLQATAGSSSHSCCRRRTVMPAPTSSCIMPLSRLRLATPLCRQMAAATAPMRTRLLAQQVCGISPSTTVCARASCHSPQHTELFVVQRVPQAVCIAHGGCLLASPCSSLQAPWPLTAVCMEPGPVA